MGCADNAGGGTSDALCQCSATVQKPPSPSPPPPPPLVLKSEDDKVRAELAKWQTGALSINGDATVVVPAVGADGGVDCDGGWRAFGIVVLVLFFVGPPAVLYVRQRRKTGHPLIPTKHEREWASARLSAGFRRFSDNPSSSTSMTPPLQAAGRA
jgi:hypothetical protein